MEPVRRPEALGCARRERDELAMVVEGPMMLPESGLSGVLAPVLEEENALGGTRLAELACKREGRGGSFDMVPSFWRSRILRSRRLM